MSVRISFIKAGYCRHPQKVAWRGGGWTWIEFPATVAVIDHPKHGVVLFDTGYSERFFQATRRWPASLYPRVTPVFLDEKATALAQLKELGIRADDVRSIVLSHFHADHIGGLGDFAKARYVYDKSAFMAVRELKGWRALRKAFLPELLPADFEDRSRSICEWSAPPAELSELSQGVDLFGDGSVWMLSLPGHTVGHVGLFVRTSSKDYLLTGDACYLRENYQFNSPAMSVAGLIFDDFAKYRQTLTCLHHVYTRHPGIEIVPCHCENTFRQLSPAKEVLADGAT